MASSESLKSSDLEQVVELSVDEINVCYQLLLVFPNFSIGSVNTIVAMHSKQYIGNPEGLMQACLDFLLDSDNQTVEKFISESEDFTFKQSLPCPSPCMDPTEMNSSTSVSRECFASDSLKSGNTCSTKHSSQIQQSVNISKTVEQFASTSGTSASDNSLHEAAETLFSNSPKQLVDVISASAKYTSSCIVTSSRSPVPKSSSSLNKSPLAAKRKAVKDRVDIHEVHKPSTSKCVSLLADVNESSGGTLPGIARVPVEVNESSGDTLHEIARVPIDVDESSGDTLPDIATLLGESVPSGSNVMAPADKIYDLPDLERTISEQNSHQDSQSSFTSDENDLPYLNNYFPFNSNVEIINSQIGLTSEEERDYAFYPSDDRELNSLSELREENNSQMTSTSAVGHSNAQDLSGLVITKQDLVVRNETNSSHSEVESKKDTFMGRTAEISQTNEAHNSQDALNYYAFSDSILPSISPPKRRQINFNAYQALTSNTNTTDKQAALKLESKSAASAQNLRKRSTYSLISKKKPTDLQLTELVGLPITGSNFNNSRPDEHFVLANFAETSQKSFNNSDVLKNLTKTSTSTVKETKDIPAFALQSERPSILPALPTVASGNVSLGRPSLLPALSTVLSGHVSLKTKISKATTVQDKLITKPDGKIDSQLFLKKEKQPSNVHDNRLHATVDFYLGRKSKTGASATVTSESVEKEKNLNQIITLLGHMESEPRQSNLDVSSARSGATITTHSIQNCQSQVTSPLLKIKSELSQSSFPVTKSKDEISIPMTIGAGVSISASTTCANVNNFPSTAIQFNYVHGNNAATCQGNAFSGHRSQPVPTILNGIQSLKAEFRPNVWSVKPFEFHTQTTRSQPLSFGAKTPSSVANPITPSPICTTSLLSSTSNAALPSNAYIANSDVVISATRASTSSSVIKPTSFSIPLLPITGFPSKTVMMHAALPVSSSLVTASTSSVITKSHQDQSTHAQDSAVTSNKIMAEGALRQLIPVTNKMSNQGNKLEHLPDPPVPHCSKRPDSKIVLDNFDDSHGEKHLDATPTTTILPEVRPDPVSNSGSMTVDTNKPASDFDTFINNVLDIFPDADVHYVHDTIQQFLTKTTLDQTLNMVINQMLENPNYPRSHQQQQSILQPVIRKVGLKNYYDEYSQPVKTIVASETQSRLSMEFRFVAMRTISMVMQKFNSHYAPSYRVLRCAMDKALADHLTLLEKNPRIVKYMRRPDTITVVFNEGEENEDKLVEKLLKSPRPLYLSKLEKHSPELQAEVDFVEHQSKLDAEERDRLMAWKLLETDYSEQGQSIECGCCFAEHPFENLVQCSDGHLFCCQCLLGYAREAIFGSGKLNLTCMTEGCDNNFPKNQLIKALPDDILQKYDERLAEENINMAAMPDLLRCPHCSIPVILDSSVKVFKCPNVECSKETCRDCKADWSDHMGKSCNQVEKPDETKIRITYEEKMTQAKVRTCPNCKAQFCKEEGCNKMTCRCGTTMCYICRKTSITYQHFCQHPRDPGCGCTQCTNCSLWTNPEEDEKRAIAEIQKEAQEKRREQGFTDEKQIGVVDTEPPSKKIKK